MILPADRCGTGSGCYPLCEQIVPTSRLWDLPVGRKYSLWQRLSPPQLFVGSFALLVMVGTLGLKFLPGLYVSQPLNWLDALFTATSAVCVTGLIVEDTAGYFTTLGQLYLLLLIQLGGLGMLTFTSLVVIAIGGRLSLRQESLSAGSPIELSHHRLDPRHLLLDVIRFTLAFEAFGAVSLYALWAPQLGWENAAWPAVFHSVSAFCNAGFSTYSDSLIGFQRSPATLAVISTLIVAGGIGFLAWEELVLWFDNRRLSRRFRLSLHTQLVFVASAVLIFLPWPLFTWLEWNASLKDLPPFHKLTNGLFLSITARTAGFNSIDYQQATEAGNFLTILLMSIGGSPGGTAGGMKTTTIALLLILAWSRLQGEEIASLGGRSLRKETTDRAVGLAVIAFALMTAGILALAVTERNTTRGNFEDRMFEAVSAFNTVGLTTGQTSHLSSGGRIVVIGLMFLGRVGPLVLAAALTRHRRIASRFRYAYEEVAVG